MTIRCGYQKERRGDGYTVWALAPYTGDRRDCMGWVDSRRDAERLIAKLRKGAKEPGTTGLVDSP